MKIICIGDSLTKGYPQEEKFSFPHLLARNNNWETENHGVNGQSSKEILERVAGEGLFLRGDKATILCGTNDFIFGNADAFGVLTNILQMAKLCADNGVKPYLVSPILCHPKEALESWLDTEGIDYDDVNDQLKHLSRILKEAAKDFGWNYIDLQKEYSDCDELVDGIHPSVVGYEFISKVIGKGLEK